VGGAVTQHSPGCKRTVISDDYYPALARKNVGLETGRIERFTTQGITFANRDSEDQVDLVVLATGFDSLSFLSPMKIQVVTADRCKKSGRRRPKHT
jgi:cation diffusion facilitator CzcD-associated flavoprotein CzcO